MRNDNGYENKNLGDCLWIEKGNKQSKQQRKMKERKGNKRVFLSLLTPYLVISNKLNQII